MRLHRAALQPEPVLEPHETQRGQVFRRVDRAVSLVLGRGLRFLLGLALLALLAVWLDAKGIVTGHQVQVQAAELYQVVRRAATAADPGILLSARLAGTFRSSGSGCSSGWTSPGFPRLRERRFLVPVSAPRR